MVHRNGEYTRRNSFKGLKATETHSVSWNTRTWKDVLWRDGPVHKGSQSEYTTIIMHWQGNAPKRGMAPPARPRGSTAVISGNRECICTSSRSMWAVELSPQHCRCRVPTCSINKVGPESEHQAQELASLFLLCLLFTFRLGRHYCNNSNSYLQFSPSITQKKALKNIPNRHFSCRDFINMPPVYMYIYIYYYFFFFF